MGPSPPLTGCPAARGLLIPREAPEEVGGGPAAAVAAAAGGRQVAVSMAHLSPRKCEVNVDYGAVPHGHCGAAGTGRYDHGTGTRTIFLFFHFLAGIILCYIEVSRQQCPMIETVPC